MLNQEERAFIEHWEKVRENHSHFMSKLSRGLPMAMLFGLPIILSLVAVYSLSPDWFSKISSSAAGSLGTLIVAVVITILFFSYFRMHFKWEMNEQLYQELKHRQERDAA